MQCSQCMKEQASWKLASQARARQLVVHRAPMLHSRSWFPGAAYVCPKEAFLADPKRDETFKVIDRRPFTPEGELRKDIPPEERRREEFAPTPAPVKDAARGTAPAVPPGPTAGPGMSSLTGTAATPATPGAAEAPASSRGFQMLVDLLARNAAALLGGMADPQTGQAYLDLEGGREMIDLLDALREKTRGNLSAEDDSLLLEVIGSLKLSYMEISKAAAQAMREKAKGKS
jgi:hypothetical protein